MITLEDLRLGANLKSLGGEALADLSSSHVLCTAVPDGAVGMWITVRAFPITFRMDGGTPTAGANGLDIDKAKPPMFIPGNKARLAAMKGIQNGGTATGWIEYVGLDGGN
jgi:hypothetical protein